jgi:TolA-binding protein
VHSSSHPASDQSDPDANLQEETLKSSRKKETNIPVATCHIFRFKPARAIVCQTIALVLFLGPTSAHAQLKSLVAGIVAAGASRAAGSGKHNYDAQTLRPEALQQCMERAHDIDLKADKLSKMSTQIESEKTALKSRKADIDKRRASKSRSAAQTAALKKEIESFNSAVDKHTEAITQYNKLSAETRPIQTDFKTACAGKKYYSSDLASIKGKLSFDVAAYAK